MKGAFTLARRAHAMSPSVLRELLRVVERPDVVSFAGGLPAADAFPVDSVREACARVLADAPTAALQYSPSEGHGPLIDWIVCEAAREGWHVAPSQVLITTGSQQGLDLVGKVLIDAGSRVVVESPTYLGALQAFAPVQPRVVAVDGDAGGPRPDARAERCAAGARFAYLQPDFRNPDGHSMSDARRDEIAARGLPVVEDSPYRELWFDSAPPRGIAPRRPDCTIRLGSLSKVLAPGLRLGYVVAPPALAPKLLQAKQAADLHTSGFSQRVAFEVLRDGDHERRLAGLRGLYRARRDAMLAALARHMPPGVSWNEPRGGMFIWLTLPRGLDSARLLPRAVERGVAFVPGAPFHVGVSLPAASTMRLSFATADAAQIERGVSLLAATIAQALQEQTR